MFNSLSTLPYIPYNIMVYLAKNPEAEPIWKMLAYNDYEALSKPDLTFDEKMALVWRTGKQEDYGVFLTGLIEDAIAESKSILKIYDFLIEPSTAYVSNITYAFDFLYGGKMSLIEYNGIPVSRGDLFINKIMTILNGAYVGGVGKLSFSRDLSRYDAARTVIGNSRTFTGIQLYLSVQVGDANGGSSCND